MPYQKGQSGNPKGRPPKGLALSDIVCAKLAERDSKGSSHLDRIIRVAIAQAKGGDKDARNWLADRGWGKAPLPVTGPGQGPLEIVVKYADH